jgi:predicted phage terminase large subunit-like protein
MPTVGGEFSRRPIGQRVRGRKRAPPSPDSHQFQFRSDELCPLPQVLSAPWIASRFDYPELKARAISHAQVHKPSKILIEDSGVGTALIAELKEVGLTVVAIKPERGQGHSYVDRIGKVRKRSGVFPNRAPWLPDLEAKLFAFPNARHDDQVDALAQALAHGGSSFIWDEKALERLDRLVSSLCWYR